MKKRKISMDLLIFALCIISLICIAARIIYTIYQFNQQRNESYVEGANCTVDGEWLEENGQYLLYGMWEYYPEQHICSEHISNVAGTEKLVYVPVQWNMFDRQFWNKNGKASYRLNVTIPDNGNCIFYLHGQPAFYDIYVDRVLCQHINSDSLFFNRGVQIEPGNHEIIVELTTDWLIGFYAFPWLYSEAEFNRQTRLAQNISGISLGGFIIAVLYGMIFLRKSQESQFFKRQIINTVLVFAFCQLAFIEFSMNTVLLAKLLPMSKIHIITLIVSNALGLHTTYMFRSQTTIPVIDRSIKWLTYLFFLILDVQMFINAYVNLQFLMDLVITFLLSVLIVGSYIEIKHGTRGILELSVSVILSGIGIIIVSSVNTQHFFSEIYYILPAIFMLVLLCYGCLIATEFAHIEKEAQKKQQLEQQLNDARAAYLTSQIQPHFQYNTLAMIQELCYSNPKKAASAIVRFSSILRRRVDFNHYSRLEPFANELACIEDYIELQKMRFENSFQFEKDIECTDFKVPPLSLQTLVENSIHHGLRKRKGNGLLKFTTLKKSGNILVIIQDNGVGFDVQELQNMKGNGIRNSRTRIELLTGGSLEIASKPDCGTKVTVKIPEQREELS